MNQQYNNPYEALNIPITMVSEIMGMLNLSSTELKNPKRFEKFRFVAEFAKDIPNKNRFFTRINKIGADKLDLFYEYCQHRWELEQATKTKDFLEEQYLKSGDETLKVELDAMGEEISNIETTLNLYEN